MFGIRPLGIPPTPGPALTPPPRPHAAAPVEAFTPASSTASWNDAVARIQRVVDGDLALQKTAGPDGLLLRPHTESIFLPQTSGHARGTVVMFHGYTAGPWQYREMAERFHDAGYNVYVPRMPGHGYADASGMPSGARLPKSDQGWRWESFVDTTVGDAAAFGVPVYAVGLSGGANVALRCAEKYTLAGVVAMAPYLGGNLPRGIIFPAMNMLDAVTFGLAGRLLDHRPWKHNEIVPNDPHPHTQGSLGQAMAMEHVGRDVRAVQCPAQFVTVDGDLLSGSQAVGRLIRRTRGVPEGWFRFHGGEGVPHAMVSPVENLAPGGAQKVSDIVFDFIDRGKASQRQ